MVTFGYVGITRFLIKLFSYAGNLLVYGFDLFMVVASMIGGPRSLYGVVNMFRGYGEGVYYPTWVAA
jgi:hypothetical protein